MSISAEGSDHRTQTSWGLTVLQPRPDHLTVGTCAAYIRTQCFVVLRSTTAINLNFVRFPHSHPEVVEGDARVLTVQAAACIALSFRR